MSAFETPRPFIPWAAALSVWWSFFWRAVVYGFLLGAVLGGAAGLMAGSPEQATSYGGLAGYLATFPASMLAMKQALTKHLGG